MKKNKNELVTLILVVVVGILSFYFYMQSKQVIATTVAHTENGGVNYKVYLSDKTYYNRDYLDEGMQYISSIIDYIDLNFNYKSEYDLEDTYKVSKKITANVKILDSEKTDKVIYTETEELKNETVTSDKVSVNDNVKLDYIKYNTLANKFKSDYGINASSILVIDYDVMYESEKNELVGGKKITVELPLSRQMLTIEKSNDISSNEPYILRTSKSALNKVMFGLFVLFTVTTVIGVVVLFIEVQTRLRKESKYDRYIAKLLKENDSYITESNNISIDNEKNVISVNSFKELLDVRNNIDKTIIYTKLSENSSKFEIIDEVIYEYIVTREDMEK